MNRFTSLCFGLSLTFVASCASAAPHEPPKASKDLLKDVDFAAAVPVDDDYRRQFSTCDETDIFRGFRLGGYYRCTTDPNHLRGLFKLKDGGIYWESKMALDVDGSYAAWGGVKWKNSQGVVIDTTDQCGTSMKWKPDGDKPCKHPDAQVDSDRFPFVVMPMAGIRKITGNRARLIGSEFASKTGLALRDMGVVIYKDKWSPVFIADGGPFMRLGEGSARLFEALGETRCKKWNNDGSHCVGPGHYEYPYRNFGLSANVVFILYPGSGKPSMTPDGAISEICAFAKQKLKLTGSATCP